MTEKITLGRIAGILGLASLGAITLGSINYAMRSFTEREIAIAIRDFNSDLENDVMMAQNPLLFGEPSPSRVFLHGKDKGAKPKYIDIPLAQDCGKELHFLHPTSQVRYVLEDDKGNATSDIHTGLLSEYIPIGLDGANKTVLRNQSSKTALFFDLESTFFPYYLRFSEFAKTASDEVIYKSQSGESYRVMGGEPVAAFSFKG